MGKRGNVIVLKAMYSSPGSKWFYYVSDFHHIISNGKNWPTTWFHSIAINCKAASLLMVPGLVAPDRKKRDYGRLPIYPLLPHFISHLSMHSSFGEIKNNGRQSSFSAFNCPGVIQAVTQLRSNTFIFPPEPAWLQTIRFSIRGCNISGKG